MVTVWLWFNTEPVRERGVTTDHCHPLAGPCTHPWTRGKWVRERDDSTSRVMCLYSSKLCLTMGVCVCLCLRACKNMPMFTCACSQANTREVCMRVCTYQRFSVYAVFEFFFFFFKFSILSVRMYVRFCRHKR